MRKTTKYILIIIGDLDLGGCEQHLCQVLPRLVDAGQKPMVYCLTHKGRLADDIEAKGVPVFSHPLHLKTHKMSIFLRWILVFPLTTFCLLVLMLRKRPAVVHSFLPSAYLLGTLCALITGVPARIMSRRSLNNYQLKHPILKRAEYFLHHYMHYILANSSSIIKQLKEEGVNGNNLLLIYNGVDIDKFKPPVPVSIKQHRRKLDLDEDSLIMTMVANMIHYKGHLDLINALSIIKDQLHNDWCLILIGRDYGIRLSIEEKAREAGIYKHIIFTGIKDNVEEYMQVADIGLLPSHQEGFSNTVIESMACGLPMIVTDVGGNPEAVTHDKSGIVVAPHDPDVLAEAILRLAGDPELRLKFGTEARKRCVQYFSLDKSVQSYFELYNTVIDHKIPT